MKKVFLIVLLLGIAGTVAILCATRRPFEEKLAEAEKALQEKRYSAALPTFKKAVKKYEKNPSSKADALYKQALCETALGKPDKETWESVLKEHQNPDVQARAEFELIAFAPDKAAAKKAFSEKYPKNEASKGFLLESLNAASAKGDTQNADAIRQALIDGFPQSAEARQAEAYIGDRNISELREAKLSFITNHVVRSGEILNAIARKYKTTADSILFVNKLNNDRIRINQRLRIDLSSYFIDVSIPEFKLRLYRIWDGQTNFFKSYPCGTGKNDNTPRGDFIVNLKQKEPVWYKDNSKPIPYGDPENALGTRWMAISSPGFGIHGTWEPDTVGKASSAGCVRLRNEDVEELYSLVKEGTPVHIHD